MIIKSMSRKTPSFSQLLNYLNKGRKENDEFFFKYNIYSNTPNGIINEYYENYRNLKKKKNSNSLYHEIISLKYQKALSIEQQRIILQDLAQEYAEVRANNNLVYAVIHEQHNQIHCHFMISSNEFENHRNKRLSQKQFDEIKKRLREYAYEKYPLLERLEEKKTKARTKAKTIDREVHLKKRTGMQTQREELKDRLHKIFTQVNNPNEFLSSLQAENIQVYQRGNTFGFVDLSNNRKYRLKTLELESEFMDMNKNFETNQEQSKEQDKTQKQEFHDSQFYRKLAERKIYLKEKIQELLDNAQTFEEFFEGLKKLDIEIYAIENTFGFVDTKNERKYRLETLELESEFEKFLEKMNKHKSFKDKLKNIGKRFLHEIVNDAEHLITGKKPTMEDEIWIQEKAGQRHKNQEVKKSNKKSQELFRQRMKEARERNIKNNEKLNDKDNDFSKK